MTTRMWPLLAVVVVCVASGCNTLARQPHLSEVNVSPNPVIPGQTVTLTVRITSIDPVVTKLEAVVREEPSMRLPLRDDGIAPDVTAHDNIWTHAIEVPFTAPSGVYNLDIHAYNKKGAPVMVRTAENSVVPLTAACEVRIEGATPAP